MEGLGPNEMPLGHLVRKLAQDRMAEPQRLQQLGGADYNRGSRGYRQGGVGATTIPREMSEAATAMFGPEAGAITSLLTMFARGPLEAQGIDVMKPYESEYGGSADDTREAYAVSQAALQPSYIEAGQSIGRLAGGLDQMVTKMFGPRAAGMVQNLWNMIPGGDAGKGMFVSQIAQAVPEIRDGLSRLDPKLVTDFSPLVDAVYMRNKGRFNKQDFLQLKDSFLQMRDQNQLGNVPAQVSIEAIPFAIKHIGPQASAAQIAGISRMAHQAQQSGLAPTYGKAMEMLDSFGGLGEAAKNPAGTMQYLSQLKQRILASGLDEASVYQMTQMAKEKGMPVRTMIEGQIGSTEAAKLFRENPQQQAQMQNAAMESFGNLANSDSMKALTVLSQKDPRWKATIDKAISSGNSAELNRLASNAMRDPTNWRLMHSADTSGISQAISNTPGAASGFMLGEAQRFAKHTNNMELGRLLADKKRMTHVLTTQDYRGLSPRTVEALSAGGRFKGRLGASFLAAQANTVKPAPQPMEANAPLSRIGLDYGKPAMIQGTTGAPTPAPFPKIPKPPVAVNPVGAV